MLIISIVPSLDAVKGDENLGARITQIIEAEQFKHAQWGILIVDLKSGDLIYELNADKLFAPASTTKLFSVASALDHLGAEFRFRTPIYRRGEITNAVLHGDLILVASGDLTLGGRTTDKGAIAFTNVDHTYANGSGTTELTSQDPLAGLDLLAQQIAEAGINRVDGNILIDARLFETATSTGSGPTRVTPILVNDNLIDITVTAAKSGAPATIDWRPRASFYNVAAKVKTVPTGHATNIAVSSLDDGNLVVTGQITEDHKPIVRVHEVDAPDDWARRLLIDVLRRANIEITARLDTSNRVDKLPAIDDYRSENRVAELESPPFAENVRLILKVSHNLHASTLPLLVAAHNGRRTLADGLHLQHDFLKRAGVEAESISFGGAAGGANADYTTPRANVTLLRAMATGKNPGRFLAYKAGLPLLGVDGTLHDAVSAQSPVCGKVAAKTGTLYWQNVMNKRYLLTSKALAGYLTAKSSRELAFSMVVNGVHLNSIEDRVEIGKTMGRLCEIVHDAE